MARGGLLALAVGGAREAAAAPGRCFDFSLVVVDPLQEPIPLLAGADNSALGTYPSGVDWASTRSLVKMPIRAVQALLLDHSNVKDMKKTTLTTVVVEKSDAFELHRVEVVVTLRAFLVKMKIGWTEEWGYRVVEGTWAAPRRIVISQQNVGGTRYIKHQCSSYVLQAAGEGSTDVSMYEEVKADRRDAEDTRKMQAGILRGLRSHEP